MAFPIAKECQWLKASVTGIFWNIIPFFHPLASAGAASRATKSHLHSSPLRLCIDEGDRVTFSISAFVPLRKTPIRPPVPRNFAQRSIVVGRQGFRVKCPAREEKRRNIHRARIRRWDRPHCSGLLFLARWNSGPAAAWAGNFWVSRGGMKEGGISPAAIRMWLEWV